MRCNWMTMLRFVTLTVTAIVHMGSAQRGKRALQEFLKETVKGVWLGVGLL